MIRVIVRSHAQITKEEVDIYKPGRHIPSCKLKAEWTKQSKPLRLIHKVTLKGAKQPFINIDLDCDPIPLGTLIMWEPNPNSNGVTFISLQICLHVCPAFCDLGSFKVAR